MFKLAVVGGPAKGKSYTVKEGGETTIGRVDGNDIVLQSTKVSKKHCVLVVSNNDVQLKDAGSSNGTFVNGVLTKAKVLKSGDRVSVGEYVLELVSVQAKTPALNNVVPIHGGMPAMQGTGAIGQPPVTGALQIGGNTSLNAGGGMPNAAVPVTPLEKIKFYFDQYIINFVYNLNEKHEWRSMMTAMFAVLVIGSAVLSVYPVLDRVSEKLGNEATSRAMLLARQIVDRNAPFVYEKMESKADVSYVEKEPGVQSAYLMDMDGRIMAPGRKLNQNLTADTEASFGSTARDKFNKSETREQYIQVYGTTVAVAVPLRIFSQSAGKNVTVAMSLVFFDRNIIMFDTGTEMLSYIQAVILAAILGVIIFFSLYRLTLRPLLALNDDIDQVLKGNSNTVNKRFKMEEISPLVDIVNAALQRAGSGGGGGASTADAGAVEEALQAMKFAADRMVGTGMLIFSVDRKIVHVNPPMEEIAGIRKDGAIGQGISDVARDAAFVAFIDDALSKVVPGGEPTLEDFEFSGTTYKMECVAVGQAGAVKLYVVTAQKP